MVTPQQRSSPGNSPHFMKPKVSLQFRQDAANDPCSNPFASRPKHQTIILKIHFNIIFQAINMAQNVFLSDY
jgi:hypothetical protein